MFTLLGSDWDVCLRVGVCTRQASSVQFSGQLDSVQHMKKQLEQRTHAIESNIQRQLDELWRIQQELQRVQEQSLQMLVQKGAVNMTAVQVAPQVAQGSPVLGMQGQVVSAGPLQTTIQQQQNTALAQVGMKYIWWS